MYFQLLYARLQGQVDILFSDDHLLSWKYLSLFFLLGFLYVYKKHRSILRLFKTVKRHVLSRRFKRSVKEDIGFYIIKILFDPIWIFLLGKSANKIAYYLSQDLQKFLPFKFYISIPTAQSSIIANLLIGLFIITLIDLSSFAAHILMHKNSFFWRFHKVHHSARYLTPLTKYRVHPIEFLLYWLATTLFLGCGMALLQTFTSLQVSKVSQEYAFYIGLILFSLLAHFRHSMIWISYPPWLSKIFISPAMHQIHHSKRNIHVNKNFGVIFSFWDRAFRSLYIPTQRERFPMGLVNTTQKTSAISPIKVTFESFFYWRKKL